MLNPFIKWGMMAMGGVIFALIVTVLWLRADLASTNADLASTNAELDAKKIELDLAVTANKSQQDYITKITKLRDENDAILLALGVKMDAINKAAVEQAEAIRDLERTNEAVREYLARPLPDDLKRMLNTNR